MKAAYTLVSKRNRLWYRPALRTITGAVCWQADVLVADAEEALEIARAASVTQFLQTHS